METRSVSKQASDAAHDLPQSTLRIDWSVAPNTGPPSHSANEPQAAAQPVHSPAPSANAAGYWPGNHRQPLTAAPRCEAGLYPWPLSRPSRSHRVATGYHAVQSPGSYPSAPSCFPVPPRGHPNARLRNPVYHPDSNLFLLNYHKVPMNQRPIHLIEQCEKVHFLAQHILFLCRQTFLIMIQLFHSSLTTSHHRLL